MRFLALFPVLVVAGLVFDTLIGRWRGPATASQVHVRLARSGRPSQAIVAFPGYLMPGDLLSAAFTPYLGDDDAMITVHYAQYGVDLDAIYQTVMVALRRVGAPELRVYGASMGGLCARQFLDRYRRDGAPMGPVVFVLDTAPSCAATVKRPQWLMALGSRYRGGPIGSMMWTALSHFERRPTPEVDADKNLIHAFHRATARAGLPAITSQAGYIASVPRPRPGELATVAKRATYLHGRGFDQDPLIRIEMAIADWRSAHPELRVVVLEQRAGRWHLPLIERPRETVAALLAA